MAKLNARQIKERDAMIEKIKERLNQRGVVHRIWTVESFADIHVSVQKAKDDRTAQGILYGLGLTIFASTINKDQFDRRICCTIPCRIKTHK